MNFQQITCQETGKNMKADKIFKVKNENCIENIVSICYNCPFSHSKNEKCKNCYGTITQNSIRQLNYETGRIKMKIETYRNTFLETDNEYLEIMDADTFLNTREIIANLNNSNWNHGQRISDPLRGYDRPKTWKTDCINCKIKCKNKGIKTACEKAKDFLNENNINLNSASIKEIEQLKLPQDCICQQQVQQMYYL